MTDRYAKIRPVEPFGETRNGPPGSKPSTNGKPAKSKAASGRFKEINSFMDQSARLVSTTAQAVWIALWRETKPDGTASVSHNQLAEMLNIARRSSIRSVATLEKIGLLEIVKRGNSKDKMPSTYKVFGRPKNTRS